MLINQTFKRSRCNRKQDGGQKERGVGFLRES